VLKNAVGNFLGSDDLDFDVTGFPAAGSNAPGAFAANSVNGVPGSAKLLNFFAEPVLDVIVTDNHDPLHEVSVHE
ncbi:MAG: hypothetical protein WBW49_12125, partial [Candidatus Acidiferrum sp.]